MVRISRTPKSRLQPRVALGTPKDATVGRFINAGSIGQPGSLTSLRFYPVATVFHVPPIPPRRDERPVPIRRKVADRRILPSYAQLIPLLHSADQGNEHERNPQLSYPHPMRQQRGH